MRTKVIYILLVTVMISLLSSCYNDNEYDLYPYPTTPCDSTNVSYSKTIAPIMSDNCNVCHSTTLASAGIITDNYKTLDSIARTGQLWSAVNWEPGFIPMPNGGQKLSSCNLAKIKNWINNGSPNN
jgi:hypothetical protein